MPAAIEKADTFVGRLYIEETDAFLWSLYLKVRRKRQEFEPANLYNLKAAEAHTALRKVECFI